MAHYISLILTSLWLSTSTGFTDVLLNVQEKTGDSDVALESVVEVTKSVPQDIMSVVADSAAYMVNETAMVTNGIVATFSRSPHEETQKAVRQVIADAWDSSNEIIFRDYHLSADVGNILMTGIEMRDGRNIDVSAFFEEVEFPEGTSAYYIPSVKQLFVLQTLDNILTIESTLADYQKARSELMGNQVEIEAKFVEVSQNTLDELGFRWNFISKNGGDASLVGDLVFPKGQDILWEGLRTTASALNSGAAPAVIQASSSAGNLDWDLYISALEQAEDTDVLSAPRVVTRSGTPAIIQVGNEEMVPRSFDIPNQDVSPYIEHTDWELEMLGVQLEVTPELRDGGLIDLEIKPRVKDIIGHDYYEVLPKFNNHDIHSPFDFMWYYVAGGGNAGSILSNEQKAEADGYKKLDEPLVASLPYFRIREMEANVTVADGSTVGMGGLIYDKVETFRDKVPVLGSIPYLGRFFRSEGEKSAKRNLIIFVTATQVDVNGRKSSEIAHSK